MIAYRHADRRFPFLWEGSGQPPARWNEAGDPPTQYLSDTPDGAWAEFVRHEEIVDVGDLAGVRRALWAVDLGDQALTRVALEHASVTGGASSYPTCRAEARRRRLRSDAGFLALSAALEPGGAAGWRVEGGLQPARARDGLTVVLFGERPDLVGWKACEEGRPGDELLEHVRALRGR